MTLCSGKGGVGKTLLATSLGRCIPRRLDANVLLIDLDFSTRGLTLLAFRYQNDLDRAPVSLGDFLSFQAGNDEQPSPFVELQTHFTSYDTPPGQEPEDPAETPPAGFASYPGIKGLCILPFSKDDDQLEWLASRRLPLEETVEQLRRLREFAATSLDVDYLIFDAPPGLETLSLAPAAVSDVNLILLEEDNVSWKTALSMYMKIAEINKRLHGRPSTYFVANKVSVGMLDLAHKLKTFSFLSLLPFDAWMHELYAHDTSSVLGGDFLATDFFKRVESEIWPNLSEVLGLRRNGTSTAPAVPPRSSGVKLPFFGKR